MFTRRLRTSVALLLFHAIALTKAATDIHDLKALANLRVALSPNNQSWVYQHWPETDPCSLPWAGVSCQCNNSLPICQVVGLDLGQRLESWGVPALTLQRLAGLQQLSHLKWLNLSSNYIR